MLPGPDYIIACPHCGENARKRSLLSANTFGAKIWSDGFMLAMMYPDLPYVVRCKKCKDFYNSGDAPVVKEISFHEDLDEYDKVEEIEHLAREDYAEALNSTVAQKPEIEFYLRRRFWWEMNHFYRRKSRKDEIPDWNPETYNKNLKHLIALSDDADILLKAELLRNLGEFNACISTLNDADEESKSFANQILEQAHRKNKIVFLFE